MVFVRVRIQKLKEMKKNRMVFVVPGDDKKYYCPVSARDVKLGKFVELMDVERELMPESMKEIVGEKDREKKKKLVEGISEVEYAHKHLPYMAKVVSVMCEIDYEKVVGGGVDGFKGMDKSDVEMLFGNCTKAVGVFEMDDSFKGFEFEGVWYEMPKRFMEGSTVIEYMEAAQYQAHYMKLKDGMWGALSYVIAILAREKGVGYSEDLVLSNGERFKALSMDVALNVSFFLMRLSKKLKSDSLFYSMARMLGALRQG